jgi:anaerobic selenocysteine-containing dehydrogenase
MGLNITRGEDIDKARCALIVGRNPQHAIRRVGIIEGGKERGAKIVVTIPSATSRCRWPTMACSARSARMTALALAMATS